MNSTHLASQVLILWNLLQKNDVEPDDVFKKVDLDPSLMYQQGARYPYRKIDELWLEATSRIADPCFGLNAAKCWHPSHFSTLGYAMIVSSTLRTMLERFIRYHKVILDSSFATLHEDKQKGTLNLSFHNTEEREQIIAREDTRLSVILSSLRLNYQQELNPVSVSIMHSRPSCSDRYDSFFQSPVSFDSPSCCLALPLDKVDLPLQSGNRDMVMIHEQMMSKYIASLKSSGIVTNVQEIIVDNLPSGTVSLAEVASKLQCSERNVQHLLQQEGTTFMSLLKKTRMEIAIKYILDDKISLLEITFLLGFAEQSSFSNSFKKWTGKSPTQYRKDHLVQLKAGTE